MLNKFESKNFLEAIHPLHLYSKLFGINCFSFGTISKGKVGLYISTFDGLCISIALIFNLSMWTIFIMKRNIIFETIKISLVFDTLVPFLFTIIGSANLCNVLVSILHRQTLSKIVNLFLDFDRLFQKIGGHIDYTKHKLINIILTLIFSIVIFMTSVLLHFNGVLGFKGTLYQQILNTTLSFIMLSSIQLAMQHFLIFILAVRRRCAELNRILRETFITDLQIKSIISKNNESDLMELLDNIQQLYGELVDISNYVSRCYSIPVIFGIAAYFCNDVMCLFGTIAIASRCQSFISIIVCCLLLVFDFGYIFAIVYAGELVKNQASQMIRLIYKMGNIWKCELLDDKIAKISLQFMHRSPQFSCGLFVCDLKFLSSIISAYILYVIIMIQFEVQTDPTAVGNNTFC